MLNINTYAITELELSSSKLQLHNWYIWTRYIVLCVCVRGKKDYIFEMLHPHSVQYTASANNINTAKSWEYVIHVRFVKKWASMYFVYS